MGDQATEIVGEEAAITESVKLLVRQFLDDSHFARLHQALSMQWGRMNSLSAAMKLMEGYGVTLSREESDRLAGLSEEQQITALVTKMPQQTNDQFQHFFLQLQLLVSTATRVRQGLENGRPDLIEHALNDAETTGNIQYILQMAIVQAGAEVSMLRRQYEAWVRDADTKMGKLIRGQDDARAAQKKLGDAQKQLAEFTGAQNEKAKRVLMTLASSSGTALVAATFKSWVQYMKIWKHEAEIFREYEDRIEYAERRLVEFKGAQINGVRKMMEKKGKDKEVELIAEVFQIWKVDYLEEKDNKANAEQVAALGGRLKNMQQAQAENTKKVLARMNGNNDTTTMHLGFSAWKAFHEEYLKNKEMEDMVKQSEKALAQFMKEKGENTKKLMNSIGAGTDQGAIKMAWDSWLTFYTEAKQEAEMAEKMALAQTKMSAFGKRGKAGANNVMQRARQHQETMLTMKCFGTWKLEMKMEATLRYNSLKIHAKRQQLESVQQMFRNFAAQLESGLKDGPDTGRDAQKSKKSMTKSDGSVSLPNINSNKPGRRTPTGQGPYPGQAPDTAPREPVPAPPRDAWS